MRDIANKKRICFIHVGMERDGAERVIAHLANEYAKFGYEVDIILLLVDICEYELDNNVNIISFVRKDKSKFANVFYWIKSIRKYIKKEKPAHIVSFSMYVNIITILASLGLNVDLLISERNDPTSDGRSFLDRSLTKILYKRADKIVFQTRKAQNAFPKKIIEKSKIIYNPVEVGCLRNRIIAGKIVNIGRLEPQKNQKLLIEAFSKVENKNAYLEIYGKGSMLSELKAFTKKLEVSDRVFFKGNVPNVHECISDANVFVLSSNFEGLSNALLEAIMMGIPVISTRCAGSDEIIEDGENGIIVDINSVNQLKNAIDLILSDEKLADKISKNEILNAKQFSRETIIKKWIEYIDL